MVDIEEVKLAQGASQAAQQNDPQDEMEESKVEGEGDSMMTRQWIAMHKNLT